MNDPIHFRCKCGAGFRNLRQLLEHVETLHPARRLDED